MKVAGLDIEDSTVRITVEDRKPWSAKSLASEEFGLPQNEQDRQGVIKDALSELKIEYGLRGVVVGLPLKYFAHHIVELPVTLKSDIKHALGFEMEKYLPLHPDEYVIDFKTIETTPAGSRNLVLSVKRSRLKWIADSIQAAGLRLLDVKSTAMEVLNKVLTTEIAADSVVLYQGGKDLYAIGLKGSQPESISVSSGPETAAQKLEILSETFNRGLFTVGLVDTDRFENLKPKHLSFDVPRLLCHTVSGKHTVHLSFLPEDLRTKRINYYPYTLAVLCSVSVLLFFSTTWLSYLKDYLALGGLTQRIEEIKSTSSELMATQKEFESIDERRQFLLRFQNRRNRQIDYLKQMSSVLPGEAWLTNYSSDEKGKIEIQGFAKRSANLIAPLEKSPSFKNVQFSSPVTIRDQKERFTIKLEVE